MSQSFGAIVPAILFLGIVFQIPDTSKEFESTLFQKGTLVYEDTFDAGLDRIRWQPRTKNWKVEEGVLVGQPDFKSAKEAEKALGRDHHLGLGPVIRLNKLPDQFVLRLRFKFEGEAPQPGRPKFDVGHHINSIFFTSGGYNLKLSDGKQVIDTESGPMLNRWIDAVIEYRQGELFLNFNGDKRHIKDEQVTLKSRDEITFKALETPESRLLFDRIQLWRAE